MNARSPRPFEQVAGGGLRLRVRVTPKAAHDRVDGVVTRDDGLCVLKLRVRAVPDKGAANRAVIAFVARLLGLPKRDVRLVSGAAARVKLLELDADAQELAARLCSICDRAG
ncbi:DUF167 family protein [Stappia sp. ES.058]|uniref:DUF167 family protein n=1 Tax=Stappia sp. ES.058 TaxID=1881061 RepID=UPI00087C5C35|nr:DUF167 family protein [Stappia sp. ES.058]SDU38872.1 hypothetical protein SAMN05428979_3401 [Stappia sp. ES.058]